jgi:MFS family permease
MRSQFGLNGLNFLTAAIQSGFGPFIAVWLTQNGWSLETIGLTLSIGTFAQLISQVPSGWLVDHIHHKRYAAGAALIALGVAATLMAMPPTRPLIWGAEIIHSAASGMMTPALAALTLTLCGHGGFSSRLGVNARYASLGAAGSAALLGLAASVFSERWVFLVTASMVLPALAALLLIHPSTRWDPDCDHAAHLHPNDREAPFWSILHEPSLHVFAIAAVLFQLANAALLPSALNSLTHRGGASGWVVSATIILPQVVVALFSPFAGRLAQHIGRRPVLLVGFAAVPLRALLFATNPGAVPLVVFQALDGVSASVFGLMLPLIAADATEASGFLNLAIGSLGLAANLGGMFSTTLAGVIADRFGDTVEFLFLAAAGSLAVGLLAVAMPETRPVRTPDAAPALAPAEAD